MPNRIVREGIIDSEAINSLSFRAEIFYRRLMSIVDDYGRYEANPAILRAKLFGLQLDQWPVSEIEQCMRELNSTPGPDTLPLLILYSHGNKNYLEISNFGQRQRSESKFPAPSARAAVSGSPTHVSKCPPSRAGARSESYAESESYSYAESDASSESVIGTAAPGRLHLAPVQSTTADRPTEPEAETTAIVRNLIHGYVDHFRIGWSPPDDAICAQALQAAGGSIDELERRLMFLAKVRDAKPSKSYGWFPTAIRNTA